jgi:hypothetical protein
MANEFARNLQDNSLLDASFTLSATTGTAANSDTFDLGADTYKPENLEVEVATAAIAALAAMNGDKVHVGIQTSTSSTFSSTDRIIADVLTAVTAGLAAQTLRYRLPSNCARYVRAYVNITGTVTGGATAATYTGSFKILV